MSEKLLPPVTTSSLYRQTCMAATSHVSPSKTTLGGPGHGDKRGRILVVMPADWNALLDYLAQVRGLDLHGYKPASLARRIQKRMTALGIADFATYRAYLATHEGEFPALFNTILINVTACFRDPEAWEVIRRTVIPRILAHKPPDQPIRAWSAGCATGEEACTIAVLLAEAMTPEAFRERVRIYATDIDDDALVGARQASYLPRQLHGMPADLRERYFTTSEDRFTLRRELRQQIVFGRHDLIHDAPISRIDLLVCRNTLMYFKTETQARVLQRFQFALGDGGFLFLGRAETIPPYGPSLQPVDLSHRISRKTAQTRRPAAAKSP